MALSTKESNYSQWEWQETDTVWRRYPCTISHKLNASTQGHSIYVKIYDWLYIITKKDGCNGTQTNLFTQHTRKIRVITNTCAEIKESQESGISLYYNYSHANIVLISTLESNELNVKDLFFRSMSNSEYEITLMTAVQLSHNNTQYQNYRNHLSENCQKYNKRKDQIETLLWSNCSYTNKQYSHANHVKNIIEHKRDSEHISQQQFVYFCRAIYIPNNASNDESKSNNDIDSSDVIDQIPLYLLTFRKITHSLNTANSEENMAKSLFVFNGQMEPISSYSYSQPLLPLIQLKNALSYQKNGYGTMNNAGAVSTNAKNKEKRTWHDLMREQKMETFSSTFDINIIIEKLLSVRHTTPGTLVQIAINDIENICLFSKTLFMQQPIFLELESPIHIIGDIHGQYFDLLRLFEHGSYPPYANYLFLGDYVDRGGQSLECILLLLCYKIKYEQNFFLLRGNHESENINRIYGFYDECKRRYSVRIWKLFVDVFNHLPIAATVCNKIFCVHGGLSPKLFITNDYDYEIGDEIGQLSFDDNIKQIMRPTDIGDMGLMCDLLWSDPSFDIDGFYDNGDRGVSYYFGKDIVDCFNKSFDIDLICRAHQVVEDGYEFFDKRKLVTIFSAPNYCGEFDNCASFMKVDDKLKCSFVTLDPQRKYQHFAVKKKF